MRRELGKELASLTGWKVGSAKMVVSLDYRSEKEHAVNRRLSDILRQSIATLDPGARRVLLYALESRAASVPDPFAPDTLHLSYLVEAWSLYFEVLTPSERHDLMDQLRLDLNQA